MKITPIYKRKSIEELSQIVSESCSYRELGRKVGYTHTCSGDTLNALKKWVEQKNNGVLEERFLSPRCQRGEAGSIPAYPVLVRLQTYKR